MTGIIQASCLCRMLHFHQPALSSSFSLSNSASAKHALYRSAFSSTKPYIACRNSRISVVRNQSSLDDTASTSAEVPQADLSLTVKRRAVDICPALKGTSIFLVGINSSIKSNLGKLLAEALRYYYFDSDQLVEEAASGKSSAKLLIETDEKEFRDTETEVLKQLSSMGRLVVCAGNGAVQCAANLAHLRHGISIWIDVPLDMVAREVVDDKIQFPASESKISGSFSEVLTQLTRKYEESRSGYATADSTVSVQNVATTLGYEALEAVTAEDVALEVLKEIEKLTRLKKMMEEAGKPF